MTGCPASGRLCKVGRSTFVSGIPRRELYNLPVGVLGDDPRWTEAFPLLARAGQDWKLRRLLEETETLHRNTAARLRALGQEDLARRAEQFAVWTRLDLDEPRAARRLYTATRDLREVSGLGSLFTKILEGALALTGADRGNVQILDPTAGSLRIAAQCGFGAEFLEYFAVVDDGASACGRAARERTQTVIVDVDLDARFAPHRDIAAASAFRAVCSTPLVEQTGRLLGVVSTHYSRPHAPPERDLEIMKRYAELAGRIMVDHLKTPPHNGAGEPFRRAVASGPVASRPPRASGLLSGTADSRLVPPPGPTWAAEGSALACAFGDATCSTIRAARTLTLTLALCEARRSRSNASSGPHSCWAMRIPLACSITGMVSSLACSRANADSWSFSRWGRPLRTRLKVACKRAVTSSNRRVWAANSSRAAFSRLVISIRESPGPGFIPTKLSGAISR